MPSPLLKVLIAHIDSVFQGPNGDYAAVLEALAGISVAQALWKPLGLGVLFWGIGQLRSRKEQRRQPAGHSLSGFAVLSSA
jgi:hypothetical protein